MSAEGDQSASERRRAARQAWSALPAEKRKKTLRLVKKHRLPSDPDLRRTAVEWADAIAIDFSRPRLVGLACGGVGLAVFGVVLLGVPLTVAFWLLAIGVVLIEARVVAASNIRRIRHAIDEAPDHDEDAAVGVRMLSDFRPRWFLRVAVVTVGAGFGSILAFVGVVILFNGSSSAAVAGSVALAGFLLLYVGIRVAHTGTASGDA